MRLEALFDVVSASKWSSFCACVYLFVFGMRVYLFVVLACESKCSSFFWLAPLSVRILKFPPKRLSFRIGARVYRFVFLACASMFSSFWYVLLIIRRVGM